MGGNEGREGVLRAVVMRRGWRGEERGPWVIRIFWVDMEKEGDFPEVRS